MQKSITALFYLILLTSCKSPTNKIIGSELQHYCNQKLTDVIVYDIYTPPVASRIYAYANIAYYEALRPSVNNTASLFTKLKGFKDLKEDSNLTPIDYRFSAALAFLEVAKSLVFSKDSIEQTKKEILSQFDELDKAVFNNSMIWSKSIATAILNRAGNDNYKKTRGMHRFSVFAEKGKWMQTPPDYADAVEPNWKLIKPLLMDSAAQFAPPPPPIYSLNKSSTYYKELLEVYETSKKLTKAQDSIAKYWDDNAFVSAHVGHLMYANKKTTPVGHWLGITEILCKQSNKNDYETAKAYAYTSCAIFDGFISCWEEKFRSRTVRPISVIRENIESEWNALLQTPAFPEYTSGHSVISAAAATVLTKLFGEKFSFRDTTELKYLAMERTFPSIEAASDEAGISRLYGGIHFRSAIKNGKEQGKKIGLFYIKFLIK